MYDLYELMSEEDLKKIGKVNDKIIDCLDESYVIMKRVIDEMIELKELDKERDRYREEIGKIREKYVKEMLRDKLEGDVR